MASRALTEKNILLTRMIALCSPYPAFLHGIDVDREVCRGRVISTANYSLYWATPPRVRAQLFGTGRARDMSKRRGPSRAVFIGSRTQPRLRLRLRGARFGRERRGPITTRGIHDPSAFRALRRWLIRWRCPFSATGVGADNFWSVARQHDADVCDVQKGKRSDQSTCMEME